MARPPIHRRQRRVGELIQVELSRLLLRSIKDARVATMTSVTQVKMSKDLKYATVYISVMGDEAAQRSTLIALEHAAGFLQRELGQSLKLRHTPHLRFGLDDRIQEGDRVLALMNDLDRAEDRREPAPPDPAEPNHAAD